MAKREALGKGISALIPEAANVVSGTSLFYCPLALIKPNPHQPRKHFEDPSLQELADSIKEKGVLTPLLVSKDQEGYTLIAGERRWRAAQMAGLERVPVILKEASMPEHLELALIENLHRRDLNPLEEAEAYQRLLELTGETQEALAKRLGKD
ncbi:MAG: ParB/RepB/Spo0J family partition protein, partial [Desulfatiglandales bacterium]